MKYNESYLKQEKLVKTELINFLKNNISKIVNSVDMSYIYIDEQEKTDVVLEIGHKITEDIFRFIEQREMAAIDQQTPFPR